MRSSLRGYDPKTLARRLAMIAVLIGLFMAQGLWRDIPGSVPEINLSAMRSITCKEGYGSGFMIDEDTLSTAGHVASMTKCYDDATGEPLQTTHMDSKHDFAIMKGNLPSIPPLKIDCGGYKKGHTYYAYGHSMYGQFYRIFRQNTMKATGEYTNKTYALRDGTKMPGMAHLKGNTVPGMSGGYIGHNNGYAVGMVNVGYHDRFGYVTGDAYSYEFKNTILCKKA
jgi:hypothetical protein